MKCNSFTDKGHVVPVAAILGNVITPPGPLPFLIPAILFLLILFEPCIPFLGMLTLNLSVKTWRQHNYGPRAKKVGVGREPKNEGFNQWLESIDDGLTLLSFHITTLHKLIPLRAKCDGLTFVPVSQNSMISPAYPSHALYVMCDIGWPGC